MEPRLIIALLSALFVAPTRNGFHAESRLDVQPARRELVCRTLLVRTVWMEVHE